ncbi:MAG: tyrosine-type recombinase/integrase [Hydrogenoanaerobacterium sp.]
MGYDYNSNKIKPVQKVITPPKNLKDLDLRDWLDEQTENFESEVKQRQTQAITLTEFTENWIADTVRVAHDRYCADLKRILPQLGSYDLKLLTPKILSDFHSRVKAETELTFTTREHIHRTLCMMLSDAVALGYLKLNPAFRTFKYEKNGKKRAVASIEILWKFIKCLDDELPNHALFYKLLLATGIRRAECVGLKWSDVNFNCGEIVVNRIVMTVPHEPVVIKSIPPRTVYISHNMCAVLQGTHKQKVDGYIFAQSNGLPMLPSTFTYRLKLICKKHGLSDLTLQEIYSTHAQLLKQQGDTNRKSYLNLQERLGL